jgi:predicted helicase
LQKLNPARDANFKHLISYLVNFSLSTSQKITYDLEKHTSSTLLSNIFTYYIASKSSMNNHVSTNIFSSLLSELLTFSFLSYFILDNKSNYEDLIANYYSSEEFLFNEVLKSYPESQITMMFTNLGFLNLFEYLRNNLVVESILEDKDPFKSIYEEFLLKFNKKLQKKTGIYYSPTETVSYICKSIEQILIKKSIFETNSSKKTNFLDPSSGTGTLLLEIASKISKNTTFTFDILKRIEMMGFDVNPVSHFLAIQNIKILGQKGFNSTILKTIEFNNLSPITDLKTEHERNEISNLKSTYIKSLLRLRNSFYDYQIVFGNPPYSAVSNNTNNWINMLLKGKINPEEKSTHNYFEVNGIPIIEKKSGWLYDDYVKFIRLGHWLVDKAEEGILSFVCNSAFLSNPSFRGMRYQLSKTFDEVYILDLHGNKKVDNPPENIKDENIFNITQGICIFIFIKNKIQKFMPTQFNYFEIWGTSYKKLNFLNRNTYSTISWIKFIPNEPFYTFLPEDKSLNNIYSTFWSIKDIFKVIGTGLITSKDSLAIQFSKQELLDVLKDFSCLDPEEARTKYSLGPDTENWKVITAQNDIKLHGISDDLISTVSYRPFDTRYTYFTGKANGFHGRPKEISFSLFNKPNLALISARTNKTGNNDHFYVSNTIIEAKCAESSTQSYIFPLKIHENNFKSDNLNAEFIKDLKIKLKINKNSNYGNLFNSENILSYIYAIFYSDVYRKTFKPFLRYDFPRLPIVSSLQYFKDLINLGTELLKLHLLDFELPNTIMNSDFTMNGLVEVISFKGSKLFINKKDYFYPINSLTFNYTIGNYKVLKKWLYGRKGRFLSYNEIQEFKKIIFAINETRKIIKKLNELNFNFW